MKNIWSSGENFKNFGVNKKWGGIYLLNPIYAYTTRETKDTQDRILPGQWDNIFLFQGMKRQIYRICPNEVSKKNLSHILRFIFQIMNTNKKVHSDYSRTEQIRECFPNHTCKILQAKRDSRKLMEKERYWDDGTSDIIDWYLKTTLKKAHS